MENEIGRFRTGPLLHAEVVGGQVKMDIRGVAEGGHVAGSVPGRPDAELFGKELELPGRGNPADLADVAEGKKQSWGPQPYCVFDLDRFSMLPGGGDGTAGAIAFDSANKRIYYIAHNGDPGYEYGYGMPHVFALRPAAAPTAYTSGLPAH